MITKTAVTVVKYNPKTDERIILATFWGLSTDEKPTVGVGNGSAFVEMDTNAVYLYDEEGGAWKEWGGDE